MKDAVAAFVYRKLLKPAPLRRAVNAVLLAILPRSVALPEGRLYLNSADPVISGALAFGVYERFELAVFRAILREGMTVLDVGANIGLYAIVAARHVGSSGAVIACEPDPVNFSVLERNVSANALSNVHLYQYALADRSGTVTLHLSYSNKGHHTLTPTELGDFTESAEVRAQTGDALIADLHRTVNVIKLDIEGAEPLALRGLAKTLAQPDLLLFFEFSPGPLKQAGFDPQMELSRLVAQGFELYHLDGRRKRLRAIEDLAAFTATFRGADYCNILGAKGAPRASLPIFKKSA